MCNATLVEGDGGRKPRRIRAGDGREAGRGEAGRGEAGRDEAGCGSHVRVGGGRRMRDIKCFNANYQKSELKNIDYLLF